MGLRSEFITLTAGYYAAGVSVVGATVDWIKFKGRDLIIQNPDDIAPQGNATATHGLVRFKEFTICERSANSVKLSLHLRPNSSYSCSLEITAVYALNKATGLETTVTGRNWGQQIAPYGASARPYVIAGPEPMSEWTVTVPHTIVQRNLWTLPKAIEMVHKSSLDMRAGRVIGDLKIDDGFGGLELDREGRWKATVTAPGGAGVEVSAGYCCPWVILSTRDWPEFKGKRRQGLAVQPTTCPPHAAFTGSDLIFLKPGESHTATWRIRGLEVSTAAKRTDGDTPTKPVAAKFPCD